MREAVNEPIKPIATEKLRVTAADLQVYVAELAYYRSWKDKDEKARGILFQNVSNGLRMKLQDCTSAKGAWEKLAKLHQVDDEDYRADIQNQLSTIVMIQADDAETFVERFETLLMTAKVAMLAAVQSQLPGKILWICASPLRYRTAGNDVVSEEDGVVAMQLPDSKKLVLQEVTYLPSAPVNLLSLETLQQKGWTFDFINGFMSYGNHRIQMYNVGPKGRHRRAAEACREWRCVLHHIHRRLYGVSVRIQLA